MRLLVVVCMSCALLATLAAQPGSAPRIAAVPENQRSSEQQAIATQFAPSGMSNAAATYMHYPALAQALLTHERYVANESTLPPRHRLLLGLRTAWLARSGYLWAHRAAAARRAGFMEEDLGRVARGPDAPGWEGFEAALLRAADELHVDSFISDPTWKALSARYDTNQMIDTVDTVGAYTMNAGAINSLGVEIEPGVSDRLPTVPYAVSAKRTNLRLQGREPRIPPVEAQPGARGAGANVFRTFVRNPPADRVRGAINSHVTGRSTLSARQRELLLMRIGVLCRSEYEYAAHSRLGRQAGMTDADVARIVTVPATGGGDPLDDALLRATDELFEDDRVSAGTWAALAKALDTRQLFDVLIAVGGYRSTSMLINSAGVQLDANMENFRFPPSLQ
jgi:4-carboxymuconolactone decarboxylase